MSGRKSFTDFEYTFAFDGHGVVYKYSKMDVNSLKRENPILIDQPEDDLDNRAIYTELVRYLRTKEKLRQIILVTHNPNIVVGADAEEIIASNQHGTNSPNPEGIKFMYRTGALTIYKSENF